MNTFFNILMAVSLIAGQITLPVRTAPVTTAPDLQAAEDIPLAEAPAVAEPPAAVEAVVETKPLTAVGGTPLAPIAAITGTPSAPTIGTPSASDLAIPRPAREQIAAPSLMLSTIPEQLKQNMSFELNWEAGGVEFDGQTLLQVSLPEGILPEEKWRSSEYDAGTRTLVLTLAVTEPQGTLRLRTDDSLTGNYLISAELRRAEVSLAVATLTFASREEFFVEKAGGSIQTADGRIKVDFPAGALPEDARVEISQSVEEAAPPASLSGLPFEIKAYGQTSQRELNVFDQEVRIEVDYSELNLPAEKEGDLFLYWYNPQAGGWEGIASAADSGTKKLSAFVNHFTAFSMGVNDWQASHLPTVDTFQVSQFTGAGTFSLPIEVPAGPGGLQPDLTLSYNSQVADQANALTQASWVGMGWSLETGSIERDTHGTTAFEGDDTFALSAGGMSAHFAMGADGKYHALDENFTRIQYYPLPGTWTVWDKQGNIYYFEDQAVMANNSTPKLTYRWSLTRVQNIFGKELVFTYFKEHKLVSHGNRGIQKQADTAVYPETIIYPHGRYRIWFEREDRPDYIPSWKNDDIYHSLQTQRLKTIHIQEGSDGTGWTDVKQYVFSYNEDGNAIFPNSQANGIKISTLTGAQQLGLNGAAYPAYTFAYDGLHLTRAENGYGGFVVFDYDTIPWYSISEARGTYLLEYDFEDKPRNSPCRENLGSMTWQGGNRVYCNGSSLTVNGAGGEQYLSSVENPSVFRPGGIYRISVTHDGLAPGVGIGLGVYDGTYSHFGPENTSDNWTTTEYYYQMPADGKSWLIANLRVTGGPVNINKFSVQLLPSFYRVTAKHISDGQGRTYTYNYTYGGAAVNDPYDIFTGTGHSQMAADCKTDQKCYVEPYSEFRGHAAVTETWPDGRQVVTTFFQDDIYKGRSSKVETFASAGGARMNETIHRYDNKPQALHPSLAELHLKGYWDYHTSQENWTYGAVSGATKSAFFYDETAMQPSGSAYGNLTTRQDYTWNGSDWSPYRKTQTYFWPKDTDVYLVGLPAKTMIYEGSAALMGISINLYDNNNGDHQTAPTKGLLTAARALVTDTGQYSQVSYGYDAWGNRTSATTHTGFGGWNTSPDPGTARTTSTTYDNNYYTYPTSIKNALNQQTTLTYDYAKGVPLSETDPNGAVTSAEYDDLGRMTALIRPGDTTNSPTLRIAYPQWNPFQATITQKIDDTTSYTVVRTYDGLGRQTQTINGGAITDTIYDSPSVTRQSLPYFSGDPVYYTTTTTELGGRRVVVQAPDGTTVTTFTDGLQTTVTEPDTSGGIHSTITMKDAWGHAASVTPPTGPEISYTYDIFDRLETAVHGDNYTTQLFYNYAGQKIKMLDPDMGTWQYQYDGAGSLIRQTDARGCTLTMTYDDLSRLTNKASSGTGCGTQVNTSYTYDEGTNGEGRRTSMTDASGSTSWTYDARGRIASETRNISGSSFTTGWNYNSAGLPIRISYPGDGELVDYEYNSRMLLDTVSSGINTYVSGSRYDSAGRTTSRSYGNGTQTGYDYYAWDTQGGRLKAIQSGTAGSPASLQDLNYLYDAAGSVISIQNDAASETQDFDYDALNRLTSWTLGGVAENYSYDPTTGNLAQNRNGQLVYGDPAHPHAVTVNGTDTSFAYDWNGNMTYRKAAGQVSEFTYDAEGRLASVQPGAGTPPPTVTPPTPTGTPTPIPPVFADVPDGYPNKASIETLYHNGITGGCGTAPLRYCPENNTTRAETTVFLLKAEHGGGYTPPAVGSSTGFADVPTDYWTAAWIKQFAAEGITSGCGNGNFCPDEPVTREQLAVFMLKAKHGAAYVPPAATGSMFSDVAADYWAAAWIEQFANEIGGAAMASLGCSPGLYCPQSPILRRDVAVFVVRAFNIPLASTPLPVGAPFGDDKGRVKAAAPDVGDWRTGDWRDSTVAAAPQAAMTMPEARIIDPTYHASKVLAMPSPLSAEASFLYDGDGRRVAQTLNGVTTYFVGNYYEVTGGVVTKYYFAGAQRIAMRQDGTLYYLLSDHLGSTSITTDSTGNKISELRYTAWGEVRYQSGVTPTQYQFTGQMSYTESFGLMYYGARWYDPYLNRFAQADTIIPGAGNSQAWDRYAYVSNSPLRYVDPTGHKECDYQCQIEYERADPNYEHYCEDCEWDVTEQRKNEAIAETILYNGTELAASILFEPADWALTVYHCANGDCSVLALAFMVLPGVSGKIGKTLDDVPWKSVVDSKYWDIVEGAFKGEPKVTELTNDLKVFRHYGGDSFSTGSPWFSIKPYVRPGNARRYLALPNINLATNVAEFIIPKGTKVLVGPVASKISDSLFGSYAVGGGLQIYLPNPTIAR